MKEFKTDYIITILSNEGVQMGINIFEEGSVFTLRHMEGSNHRCIVAAWQGSNGFSTCSMWFIGN